MKAMFRKKKELLFGDHIETSCEYCVHSKGENCACRLHLCRKDDGTCGNFAYDPLKRSPKAFPPIRPLDADEFKL